MHGLVVRAISYCCFLQGKACFAGSKHHASYLRNMTVTPCLQGHALPREQRTRRLPHVCWLPVSWAHWGHQCV